MTPARYRAALAALHLTQAEAARLLGYDVRTSRKWANGERKIPPAAGKLLKLLVAGKITTEDLRGSKNLRAHSATP